MRKPLLLTLAAVLGVATALALAACGGSDTQPSLDKLTAQQLLSKLDEVQSNFDDKSCSVASIDAQDLLNEIDALPSSVDTDLRAALQKGATQLTNLLNDPSNCEQPKTTTTTPTDTTTSTDTTTTETTTTPPTTTTTPPTTTTTPTIPTTPTTTPSGGTGL